MEKEKMKKYLLVINYFEEETYLYNSMQELLEDWECQSIDELLNKSGFFFDYIIYEISNIWSLDNE